MPARRSVLFLLTALAFASAGCGKSEPAPAPTVAPKPTEPAKEPEAKEPKKTEPEAKPEPKPEPKKEPTGETPPPTDPTGETPPPTEPTGLEPKVNPGVKSTTALFPLTATPGTIVKDPNPESPEGLIQRAIMAAMEPDEAKAWAAFEALLHEDQKYGQALVYRREMNFPAMRRKVKLFLIEDETKPIYKISRILEEGNIIRIFVHNKQSMPTPCEVRLDATNHWKIGICSL